MEAVIYLIILVTGTVLLEFGINLKSKYEKLIEKSNSVVDYLVMVAVVVLIGFLVIGLEWIGMVNPLLNISRGTLMLYGFYIVFPCKKIVPQRVMAQDNIKKQK